MHHAPARWSLAQRSAMPSAEKDLDFVLEPVVNLAHGRTVASELLARPRSGLGFERWTGASFPQIAASVTRMALRRYGAMGPQGVPMHINVTALDLERPELAREVAGSMSPECCAALVLEVTEQYPLRDSIATRTTIDRLRALGVRFAVDDFGEGWSNFMSLRILDPDVIKVTLRMLGGDEPDDRLARWIIETAQARSGAVTVLEQIESQRQLDWARSMGFDAGQGYWWRAGHRAAG